jgi:hypothetical protein
LEFVRRWLRWSYTRSVRLSGLVLYQISYHNSMAGKATTCPQPTKVSFEGDNCSNYHIRSADTQLLSQSLTNRKRRGAVETRKTSHDNLTLEYSAYRLCVSYTASTKESSGDLGKPLRASHPHPHLHPSKFTQVFLSCYQSFAGKLCWAQIRTCCLNQHVHTSPPVSFLESVVDRDGYRPRSGRVRTYIVCSKEIADTPIQLLSRRDA